MADHPSTLINIITGEPIDQSDTVKDEIQDDMSTGSSKADSFKCYVVTPQDKNKSRLPSPDKYTLIKCPKNRTIQTFKN